MTTTIITNNNNKGSIIEIPDLQVQRKVKSLQMVVVVDRVVFDAIILLVFVIFDLDIVVIVD